MAEGIRCGCAGMGAFSNAYNHQRDSGAGIAARSGPAIRTESSAPSSGQSPSAPSWGPLPPYQPGPLPTHTLCLTSILFRRGSIAMRTGRERAELSGQNTL